MFSKGDLQSVILLLRGFYTFSLASGLSANPQKSAVYFGNVQQNVKNSILNASGFSVGSLPFRYLGIPLSTKR